MADDKNIRWHSGMITREARWAALGHKGATVWFTGLSGSGKSSVAVALESVLCARKIPCYRLDGDNLRHGLNSDLGFAAEDRDENVRRAAEVARMFADFGAVSLASFISPYAEARAKIRDLHTQSHLPFYEVFVHTPLEVCEARDPKGLYAKARRGELKGMTGIDAPFEIPVAPDLAINGDAPQQDNVTKLLEMLGIK